MNKQFLINNINNMNLTQGQEMIILNCSLVDTPNFDNVVNAQAVAITKKGEFVSRVNGYMFIGKKLSSEYTIKKMFNNGEILCNVQ